MLHSWEMPDRSAATRAEVTFKKLSRKTKLAVIAGDHPFPPVEHT